MKNDTEKREPVFSAFCPHGSKEKISGSDFKIRATNFKKQAINFSPSENPFKKHPKNADKKHAWFFQFQETDEYEGMTCKIPSDAYRARRNFVFDVATTVAECSNGSVILR